MKNMIMSGKKLERSVMGIDKITIRVDMKYINREFKHLYRYENNGIVKGINVINKNRYYYVNFHDCLFLDPTKRMADVILGGMYDLFLADKPLLNVEPNWNFLVNETKLSECEIFFDSINYSPFTCYESNRWNIYRNTTLYTDDFKKKYRKNGELKETQHSLICIYDRGKKIGGKDQINRLEYRLRGKYVRNLHILDLNAYFPELYHSKIFPILVWYTDRLLDQYMIEFDFEKMQSMNSGLLFILLRCQRFGILAKFHLQQDQLF